MQVDGQSKQLCIKEKKMIVWSMRKMLAGISLHRSTKRCGCLLSYSQAEPGRELTQPSPRLLAEPCTLRCQADKHIAG